jgi:hypothetical protein
MVLVDLELLSPRVNKVAFATRVFAVQLPVSLECRAPIRTHLDDCDSIKNAAPTRRVRSQRLDDEPLIGMGSAHVLPVHATTIKPSQTNEQILSAQPSSTTFRN